MSTRHATNEEDGASVAAAELLPLTLKWAAREDARMNLCCAGAQRVSGRVSPHTSDTHSDSTRQHVVCDEESKMSRQQDNKLSRSLSRKLAHRPFRSQQRALPAAA